MHSAMLTYPHIIDCHHYNNNTHIPPKINIHYPTTHLIQAHRRLGNRMARRLTWTSKSTKNLCSCSRIPFLSVHICSGGQAHDIYQIWPQTVPFTKNRYRRLLRGRFAHLKPASRNSGTDEGLTAWNGAFVKPVIRWNTNCSCSS